MRQDSGHSTSTRSLALRLGVMVVAMFGFGFLLVPIYDAFCEITGLGGKTNKIAISEAVVADDVVISQNASSISSYVAQAAQALPRRKRCGTRRKAWSGQCHRRRLITHFRSRRRSRKELHFHDRASIKR